MDLIVKRGWVDNGEKVHGYGETVRGISENEAKRLIKSGMCEPALSASSVPKQAITDEGGLQLPDQVEKLEGQTPDDLDQTQGDMTPEEFSEAKAEEQKKILTDIGIEPASKEDVRIDQYTEWYNMPVSE